MADLAYVYRLPGGLRAAARLLTSWCRQVGSRHLFVSDGLGISVAAFVALAAATDESSREAVMGPYLWVVAIIVPAQLAVNLLLGLYASSWHFTDVRDTWRITTCSIAGTAAAVLVALALTSLPADAVGGAPPAAFWVMQAILTLAVLAAPRLMIRYASELSERDERRAGRQRTLLYGAGWAGAIIAHSAERNPGAGVTPVGFLDDDPDLRGSRVGGLHVLGDTSAIAGAQRRTGASAVLITMPYSSGADMRRVADAAGKHGLTVRTVPAMAELLDGMLDVSRARPLELEDLFRGSAATEPSTALTRLLKGRAVMVTGAGGQIGSELVRQILALKPDRIVMVDRAEQALGVVAGEVRQFDQVAREVTLITTHLLDVANHPAITELIRRTRPVAIFHAATLTSLPTQESPAQATRVNIGGTKSLIDAATQCGIERFVLVSTDEALKPSTVAGASMRIAEMIVSDAARRSGSAFGSVRCGSLLDSNGSTVPRLRVQLENDQPLSIGVSELTCYPMSVSEASKLILEIATLPKPGGLYLLDRGVPVPTRDIARDLIRLSGREPDSVPIRVVSRWPSDRSYQRPGHDEENAEPSAIRQVLRSTSDQATPVAIRADMEQFLALARDGHDDTLRAELLRYVRSDEHPSMASGYRPAHARPRGQRASTRRRRLPATAPMAKPSRL